VVITREKIVDYLLSDTHHDGRHEAAFFKRFGFMVTEGGLGTAGTCC
jgi:hypothetical protein